MSENSKVARVFAPEIWGQVERFSRFYFATYQFEAIDQRALSGVLSHFHKAVTATSLVSKLGPGLEIDRAQLVERGFTPARNAAEVATVFESAVSELYSSVDCTVKVLRAIYGKRSINFKGSTRKFFQSINSIRGDLPESIKDVVRRAKWYKELLFLRDELTHLSTGHITQNPETNEIQYMHSGIKVGERVFVIDDVVTWLKTRIDEVNGFLGEIFLHLNSTLKDEPVLTLCGFVDGLILQRMVSPVSPLTFDSGSCVSYVWFELPDRPTCPFVGTCGAYHRKEPPLSIS